MLSESYEELVVTISSTKLYYNRVYIRITRKAVSCTSAANIETLMTLTEASVKWGYFIKIWVGYFKIQAELNLVRINNTVEPRYNEHGLYQIHRYRTLVSDHKSTLCQLFCLLRTSNFKCFKKKFFNLKFHRSHVLSWTSDGRDTVSDGKNSNDHRR